MLDVLEFVIAFHDQERAHSSYEPWIHGIMFCRDFLYLVLTSRWLLPDQVGHKIDILLLQFTETVNRLCWSVEGLIVCIEDFVEQLEGFIKVMFFYIDQEEEAQEWIPEECCQLVVENMLHYTTKSSLYFLCKFEVL